MASATTEKNEKAMATEVIAPPADEGGNRPERRAGAEKKPGTSFFTIYKKGQGYWTRMGTAVGAFLLCLLIANFLYTQLRAWFSVSRGIALGVGAGVFAVLAVFCWRMMNKPTAVDFLIATDSEMKKVNWTTRKELIGSTKVVIFFVLLISALLFLIDLAFGYLFHLIRVLEFGPFQ
jgi:preprotein translocase subunit SecE